MHLLNRATERIFAVIKEGTRYVLLNAKLNDTDQKILRAEAVHMCKLIRNIMATRGSNTSPFETFYAEK